MADLLLNATTMHLGVSEKTLKKWRRLGRGPLTRTERQQVLAQLPRQSRRRDGKEVLRLRFAPLRTTKECHMR
ncbi:MAG: hypothetical protein AAB403_10485 [Planctomycetota bacterium]